MSFNEGSCIIVETRMILEKGYFMKITDMREMNNQIFSKGEIQVSPQHLQMLNMQSPTLFKPKNFNVASNSGYKIFLTGYAQHILTNEKNTHIYFKLEKILNQLRSNPRPIDGGYQMKNSIDSRMSPAGSYNVWYKINSGQVVVYNIELRDIEQEARDRLEKPGLYKIKKTAQGNWVKEFAATKITTQHAAVNGMKNNLSKATWLMGSHIDFEYGKSAMKEFTLFHNPSIGFGGDLWESVKDKFGFTSEVSQKFSKVLQDSQKEGKEIKWVAHSQGGIVFSEGVRYFLNGNSSWAIFGGFNGIFQDKEDIDLSNHKVAFHSNASNNFRSKLLYDRAGIEVLATRANDYDAVNILAGNTLNIRKIIGSAAYFSHIKTGSVLQSPHTLMQTQEDWGNNMENGFGRGRNELQKGFEAVNNTVESTARYINNFLK